MSSAGKLEMLLNLLNSGFLCQCPAEDVETIDEWGEEAVETVILHGPECKGHVKIKELLNKKE